VAGWLSVWTGQALWRERGPASESRGIVWGADGPQSELTGWSPAFEMAYVYGSRAAATAKLIGAAVELVSRGRNVPLEWRLKLRSETASDPRQALIDAATAAEVALSRGLRSRLSKLSAEALEGIIVGANGAVGMVKLIEALDGVDASNTRWKRFANRVANPRNLAVHEGRTPDHSTLSNARHEVVQLLREYSPIPAPLVDGATEPV
jgi:hypothetical protein